MKEDRYKIFINGNVITMDRYLPEADYIVIKNGIILDVGTANNKSTFCMNTGEVIDLQRKTVLPGFTDCHMHLLAYSNKKERQVDLSGVRSVEQLMYSVKRFILENDLRPGDWVIGAGWNNDDFPGKSIPDKNILDSISKVHPIKLTRACYHLHSVNSLALKLAGINKDTPGIDGGQIDKDCQGYPTGILTENAIELIDRIIPGISSRDTIKNLIIKGCIDMKKTGITTVHTDDFPFAADKTELLLAYTELASEGKLPIRVVLQLRATGPEDIETYKSLGIIPGKVTGRLFFGPIKIIADGSLGARTAALNTAYSDDPENNGLLIYQENRLEEMIALAIEAGFDPAVHAIGDRAYETALNVFNKYKHAILTKGIRPSIIHCQVGSKRALELMRDLGITANIQPIFINSDWKIAENRIGKERLKYSYCWKDYIDMGIRCVGSSDAPVEPLAPLYGIYSAVVRKDLCGNPQDGWLPDQRLSIYEAMKLFTVNPHYLIRQQHRLGSISKGKLADMVILSEDILSIPPSRIKDIDVIDTFVGSDE